MDGCLLSRFHQFLVNLRTQPQGTKARSLSFLCVPLSRETRSPRAGDPCRGLYRFTCLDPCTPPDPYPTSVNISRQRLSEGSEARWALNHNLRKLTLGTIGVAQSSAGRWGRGQKALPPLCAEHTEAQGQRGSGRRADWRWWSRCECTKRTLAAQGSQVSLPRRLQNPKSPRRQRNLRGHWAARCSPYPGSQRFASV